MAKMKKYALKQNYVQVPNETALDVENNISLQALGLIVNLWSYNVDVWELHKTELYKRYAKNKETSVRKTWNELVENKYIFEYKYRDGKKWEYVYVYRIEPFDEEEIKQIIEDGIKEHGEIKPLNDKYFWGLDFQDLNLGTSFCVPQNNDISNNELKKDNKKEIINKNNNLSINEREQTKIPASLYSLYEQLKDRLIDRQITLFDIEIFYEECKNIYDNNEIESAIKNIAYSKDRSVISNFNLYMIRTLDNARGTAKENKDKMGSEKQHNNNVKKDKLPKWLEEDASGSEIEEGYLQVAATQKDLKQQRKEFEEMLKMRESVRKQQREDF